MASSTREALIHKYGVLRISKFKTHPISRKSDIILSTITASAAFPVVDQDRLRSFTLRPIINGPVTTALYFVKMPSLSSFVIERQTDSTAPVDTTSNAPSILAINGFFMGFALLVVGARIYVRGIMLKTVGPDDYVILLAMVGGLCDFSSEYS